MFRVLTCLSTLLIMIFIMQGSLIAGGGNSLSVVGGGVVVQGAGSATFGVTMTNDAEVEGFVVAHSVFGLFRVELIWVGKELI